MPVRIQLDRSLIGAHVASGENEDAERVFSRFYQLVRQIVSNLDDDEGAEQILTKGPIRDAIDIYQRHIQRMETRDKPAP